MTGINRVKEESPSPDLDETASPPKPVITNRQPDLVFEDYLFRSRRKNTRDPSPLCHDTWQDWSWSQLKAPVWVVASYPEEDDQRTTNMNSQSRSAVDAPPTLSRPNI